MKNYSVVKFSGGPFDGKSFNIQDGLQFCDLIEREPPNFQAGRPLSPDFPADKIYRYYRHRLNSGVCIMAFGGAK